MLICLHICTYVTYTHAYLFLYLEHADGDENQEAHQLGTEPHDEVGGAGEQQGAQQSDGQLGYKLFLCMVWLMRGPSKCGVVGLY